MTPRTLGALYRAVVRRCAGRVASRSMLSLSLAVGLLTGCSGGGDGFLDKVNDGSTDDPSGLYRLTFAVSNGTGDCEILNGTTGSITLVVTPSIDGTFRVHIRIGTVDAGPYLGEVTGGTLNGLTMDISGIALINQDTAPSVLKLDGTTLVFGANSVNGTTMESVSGSTNCTLERAVSGPRSTGSVAPSGNWTTELAVLSTVGGCGSGGQVGDIQTVTATFVSQGNDAFIVELDDGAGDVDVLNAAVAGNTLQLLGNYSETQGTTTWTVKLSDSDVDVSGDFFSGTIDVDLTGDVECSQVLGVFGIKDTQSLVFEPGTFLGAWNPRPSLEPRALAVVYDSELGLSFDLWLDGASQPAFRSASIPLAADKSFVHWISDSSGASLFGIRGRFSSPDELMGEIVDYRRSQNGGRVGRGPFLVFRAPH